MRAGLVVATLLVGVAVGQRAAPIPSKPTGFITGHVFYGDTNGPARLAKVILEPADAFDGYTASESKSVSAHLSEVETLPDGSFAVPHVAPGAYYVFASAPGYVSPVAALGLTTDQLSKPDKAVKERIAQNVPRVTVQANVPAAIDLTLQRGAAVSGTVLYDDGTPAAGLRVRLLVRQKDGQKEKWVEPRSGPVQEWTTAGFTTDDRGTYRLAGLPARAYLISVDLSVKQMGYDLSGGGGFGSMQVGEFKIPVYSGSKLRTKDAVPFTLKLGEERPGEDITIPLAKLHSVAGSLTAASDGHVLNGGTVMLLYADDRSEAGTANLSKDDSVWTMSFVPEGDYLVKVTNGADVEYREFANPPGTTPPTHVDTHTVHQYGVAEQPLHVDGEVSGLAIAVPEQVEKRAQASQ